jgi:hypothetical protein
MRLVHPHRQRKLATSLALAILVFRAYAPPGFTPASGTPFLLEICPSGPYASPFEHHSHHHAGGHAHFEECPFGSTPAAAPVSHFIAFEPAGQIAALPLPDQPLRSGVSLERAHRARAPPTPA